MEKLVVSTILIMIVAFFGGYLFAAWKSLRGNGGLW